MKRRLTAFHTKPRKPLQSKKGFTTRNRTFSYKKSTTGQTSGKKTPSKLKPKGYQVPQWFKSLKPGTHGQTIHQRKYWKVVSDHVRQEDFKLYGGKCVSCPRILTSWQEGHCGHYKAWATCNGFMKFERKNLALQCPYCNHHSDGPINEAFKQELIRRYGEGHIQWINEENLRHQNTKMEVWEIVERTALILGIPLST